MGLIKAPSPLLTFGLMGSLAGGLPAPAAAGDPFGAPSGIVVAGYGQSDPTAPCEGFRVTPAQVRAFLRRAVVITHRQEHDYFNYGPCYAHGTLKTRYGNWEWTLRNLGTGALTSTYNEETFVLADPRQESPLSGD